MLHKCGFAATVALFAITHLSTSPTTKPEKINITIKDEDAPVVSVALTCGFILPSIIVSLLAPGWVSHQSKHLAAIIWQGWPVITCSWWYVSCFFVTNRSNILRGVSRAFSKDGEIHVPKRPNITGESMEYIRMTFSFLILVSGLTHIHAWSLSLTATYLPSIFEPRISSFLDNRVAFFPSTLNPSSAASASIANSVQYDEIIGGSALFIWVFILYVLAKWQRGERLGARIWAQMIFGTLVAGPATGAVALIWARDEMLMKGRYNHSAVLLLNSISRSFSILY